MTEIKPVSCNEQPVSSYEPVYQSLGYHNQWKDINKERYETLPENHRRILHPAAAYEALQKENESLKWQKDNVARLGLKANETLKAETAAQAKRIAELEETNELLQTQVHCLEIVAASKNGE